MNLQVENGKMEKMENRRFLLLFVALVLAAEKYLTFEHMK